MFSQKYLLENISHFQDIVERHTDPHTLLACSRVYESLCIDELSISAKCQTVRGTLLDRLVDLYRDAFLNYFNDQVNFRTKILIVMP